MEEARLGRGREGGSGAGCALISWGWCRRPGGSVEGRWGVKGIGRERERIVRKGSCQEEEGEEKGEWMDTPTNTHK